MHPFLRFFNSKTIFEKKALCSKQGNNFKSMSLNYFKLDYLKFLNYHSFQKIFIGKLLVEVLKINP